VPLTRASDIEIWDYATRMSAIVINKDEDPFYLANKPGTKARLFWIRLGNCRSQMLLDVLEEL
jgi:predicted nuclease of predicted toxin-antitoxin system